MRVAKANRRKKEIDLQQMLVNFEGNVDGGIYREFMGLSKDSEKALYLNCNKKHSKLSVTLDLLKLRAESGISYVRFTKMLNLVTYLLPDNNELPQNTYKSKKVICLLGLEVQKIEACM